MRSTERAGGLRGAFFSFPLGAFLTISRFSDGMAWADGHNTHTEVLSKHGAGTFLLNSGN